MRILRGQALSPHLLVARRRGGTQAFLETNAFGHYELYGSGRRALHEGLRLLRCGPGQGALLPAYICNAAVQPFHALGMEVHFYQVLPNLEPDFADIERRVNKSSKVLLTVDYFGFPQPFKRIEEVCRSYGLYSVDDNAPSFLSRTESRLLGTFGDIGIASLRKTLPVPNGGVLYVNGDKSRPIRAQRPPVPASLAREGPYLFDALLGYLEARVRFPKSRLGRALRRVNHPPTSGDDRNGDSPLGPLLLQDGPSALTTRLADRLDLESIVTARRSNYLAWLEAVSTLDGVRPLYTELPEGVCPQVCPIVADDPPGFAAAMRRTGVAVFQWPELPAETRGSQEYPLANYLAQHVFALPVHQDVDPKYLRVACDSIQAHLSSSHTGAREHVR